MSKKTIKSKKNSAVLEELLREELRLLTILEHPHIVRALGICEDENDIYVAMELMPSGNLAEMLQKIKEKKISFTEADAANLI